MAGFWVPGVEQTDALVEELLRDSGAVSEAAFKWALRFAGPHGEVALEVGRRLTWRDLASAPVDRRMRRAWIVFAIVEAPQEYVVWKLDMGTERRIGDGWRVAGRVANVNVREVQEFAAGRGGTMKVVRLPFSQ